MTNETTSASNGHQIYLSTMREMAQRQVELGGQAWVMSALQRQGGDSLRECCGRLHPLGTSRDVDAHRSPRWYGPICDGPICGGPICDGPIEFGPIEFGPICDGPICDGPNTNSEKYAKHQCDGLRRSGSKFFFVGSTGGGVNAEPANALRLDCGCARCRVVRPQSGGWAIRARCRIDHAYVVTRRTRLARVLCVARRLGELAPSQ